MNLRKKIRLDSKKGEEKERKGAAKRNGMAMQRFVLSDKRKFIK